MITAVALPDSGTVRVVGTLPNGQVTVVRRVGAMAPQAFLRGAQVIDVTTGGMSVDDTEAPLGIPVKYEVRITLLDRLIQQNLALTPNLDHGLQTWLAGSGRTLFLAQDSTAPTPTLVAAVSGQLGSSAGYTITPSKIGATGIATGDWAYLFHTDYAPVSNQVEVSGFERVQGPLLVDNQAGVDAVLSIWRRKWRATDSSVYAKYTGRPARGLLVWIRNAGDDPVQFGSPSAVRGALSPAQNTAPAVTVPGRSLTLTVSVESMAATGGVPTVSTGTTVISVTNAGGATGTIITTLVQRAMSEPGTVGPTTFTYSQADSGGGRAISMVIRRVTVPGATWHVRATSNTSGGGQGLAGRTIATTGIAPLTAGQVYLVSGMARFVTPEVSTWDDVKAAGTWDQLKAAKPTWDAVRTSRASTEFPETTTPAVTPLAATWSWADMRAAGTWQTVRQSKTWRQARETVRTPSELEGYYRINPGNGIDPDPLNPGYYYYNAEVAGLRPDPTDDDYLLLGTTNAVFTSLSIALTDSAGTVELTAPVQIRSIPLDKTNIWVTWAAYITAPAGVPSTARLRIMHGTNAREFATAWDFTKVSVKTLADAAPWKLEYMDGDTPVPADTANRLTGEQWLDYSGDASIGWVGTPGASISRFLSPSIIGADPVVQVDAPSGLVAPPCLPILLSDPINNGTKQWFGLLQVGQIVRPAREGEYVVLNRADTVVSAMIRGWERGTLELLTETFAQRETAVRLFSPGRILLLRNPDRSFPENDWYIGVGDVSEDRIGTDQRNPERMWTVPFKRVARPTGLIESAAGVTWQEVLDGYTDWSAVRAQRASWLDVLTTEPAQ